jgi:hypothetical protein
LLRRIDKAHFTLPALNASLETMWVGKEPPVEMLVKLIRAMDGNSLADWTDISFSHFHESHAFILNL